MNRRALFLILGLFKGPFLPPTLCCKSISLFPDFFFLAFICSHVYHVPDTVLGAINTTMNKIETILALAVCRILESHSVAWKHKTIHICWKIWPLTKERQVSKNTFRWNKPVTKRRILNDSTCSKVVKLLEIERTVVVRDWTEEMSWFMGIEFQLCNMKKF